MRREFKVNKTKCAIVNRILAIWKLTNIIKNMKLGVFHKNIMVGLGCVVVQLSLKEEKRLYKYYHWRYNMYIIIFGGTI